MSQNWRTETNAEDYLGHQKKQLQVADRRPVIRNASDLLGPGFASGAAIRITNYNDLLAQFNGFFSSAAGATFAPTAGQNFIGQTINDSEFGGVQVFYGMEDAICYRRIFTRNPADVNTIIWGEWFTHLE